MHSLIAWHQPKTPVWFWPESRLEDPASLAVRWTQHHQKIQKDPRTEDGRKYWGGSESQTQPRSRHIQSLSWKIGARGILLGEAQQTYSQGWVGAGCKKGYTALYWEPIGTQLKAFHSWSELVIAQPLGGIIIWKKTYKLRSEISSNLPKVMQLGHGTSKNAKSEINDFEVYFLVIYLYN